MIADVQGLQHHADGHCLHLPRHERAHSDLLQEHEYGRPQRAAHVG
jgi:hypothetical protein